MGRSRISSKTSIRVLQKRYLYNALKQGHKQAGETGAAAVLKPAGMVNRRLCIIFNGILESWNPRERPQKHRENAVAKNAARAVNHTAIYHTAPWAFFTGH